MPTDDTTTARLQDVKVRLLAAPLPELESPSSRDLNALITICKSIAETQKTEEERLQMTRQARSESLRFWVPLAASFLSVAILAATLISQTRQFQKTSELQRQTTQAQIDANEDTDWREAVKIMADKPTLVNAAAGVSWLRYFMNSNRHKREALNLSTALLGEMVDADAFRDLLESTMKVKDPMIISRLLRVDRRLSKTNDQLAGDTDKITQAAKGGAKVYPLSIGVGAAPQVVPIDDARGIREHMSDEVLRELRTTTAAVALLLKQTSPAPRGLDLRECFFVDGNLNGVDFSNANVSGIGFANSSIDGADFANVTADDIGNWSGTAWWRARHMSSVLSEMLLQRYPFPKSHTERYLGSTFDEYQTALARLGVRR